jgi:hypothetical protein
VCRCAIVLAGGQRNTPLGIPKITPPPATHVKSPKGREIPHWKYPQAPLVGLGGASSVQVATAEPRHIGTAAAARAAGAELPQHPLPVGPPWGILGRKCKVPLIGAVTLGIHHAKYPKRRGLRCFVPKYPKKGQTYTKSENTPGNTPGIPNGVFNPGYFLSFLRSVLQWPNRAQSSSGAGRTSSTAL